MYDFHHTVSIPATHIPKLHQDARFRAPEAHAEPEVLYFQILNWNVLMPNVKAYPYLSLGFAEEKTGTSTSPLLLILKQKPPATYLATR